MVCVRDFRDLCPRLSPRGSFGESRRNGIWAIATTKEETLSLLQTCYHDHWHTWSVWLKTFIFDRSVYLFLIDSVRGDII